MLQQAAGAAGKAAVLWQERGMSERECMPVFQPGCVLGRPFVGKLASVVGIGSISHS